MQTIPDKITQMFCKLRQTETYRKNTHTIIFIAVKQFSLFIIFLIWLLMSLFYPTESLESAIIQQLQMNKRANYQLQNQQNLTEKNQIKLSKIELKREEKQNLQKFIYLIFIQQLVSNRLKSMKPNQKFGENLSDGNMTQSLKLDYGNSDYEVKQRKQFMKYAGGQFQTTDQPYKPEIILPDTKPIKTQYSLVGQLESGFTKLKNNQVEYLKQLRKQFKQIRDLPNTKIKQEEKQKMSNSSSQSQSQRNPPNEDPISSLQSSQKIHKKENNINQRQQRLWNVQRKQYEYMLNNCQIKIEQLLHNEMQLKKIIHELRSSNLVTKYQPADVGSKYQSEIRELQKQLKEQKQRNYKMNLQFEKVKISSKQLSQKYMKIQSENSYKSKDQNKLFEQKRKLEEYLRLQKDKLMNCQIERRKFQMENQLLIKQKQQQLNRLQKQLEHQNVVHELNVKNLIKKFQDQIQLKDRRYLLLITQYEKLKRDHSETKQRFETQKHHHHHNNSNNQMLELMKTLIEQKRNPQNQDLARTINKLIQKLQKQPQRVSDSDSDSGSDSSVQIHHVRKDHHEEKLLAQIRILKAEIDALKGNSGEGIDLQPMKKMYEAEVAALKDTIAVLQRKLKNAPNSNPSPSSEQKQKPFNKITSDHQIKQLQKRISQLESQKLNWSGKSQNYELIRIEKLKVEKVEEQLRNQIRKKSEAEFEIFKLKKQLESNRVMYLNEKNYIVSMQQMQLQKANTNIGYWKNEFENIRNFYEQKLMQKNSQLQRALNTGEFEKIKKQYADGLQSARQEYQKQTKNLIQRLTKYETEYLEYDTLQKRYNALEVAYYDLQKSIIQSKNSNEGVDHLWLIKQTEYNNINQILRQIQSNRNHSVLNSNSETVVYKEVSHAVYDNLMAQNLFPHPNTVSSPVSPISPILEQSSYPIPSYNPRNSQTVIIQPSQIRNTSTIQANQNAQNIPSSQGQRITYANNLNPISQGQRVTYTNNLNPSIQGQRVTYTSNLNPSIQGQRVTYTSNLNPSIQGQRVTYTNNLNPNIAPSINTSMLGSYNNQPEVNQRISTNSTYGAQPLNLDNRGTQRISNNYNIQGQSLINNQLNAGDGQGRMTINSINQSNINQDGRMSNQINVDPRISTATNNLQDLRMSNQMNIDPRFSTISNNLPDVRMSNTSYA